MSQEEYLEILFNDCGFDRINRNAFLSRVFKREVKYLDELSSGEKSHTITLLKEIKDNKFRPWRDKEE